MGLPLNMNNSEEHSLGHRAFFLFLSKRIKLVLVLFGLTLAVWYGKRLVPTEYLPWAIYLTQIAFLISLTYFSLILIRTYLEYRRYTYTFTEEAFILTHGYITRNELAAVYHQIQSVSIIRSPLDRLIGVSQLVIMLTGADKDPHHARVVLPGVGKTKAKLVQKELLTRARKHAFLQPTSFA